MTPPRRIATVAATLTLAAMTTACGVLGQAVDCNAVASEAQQIATEWSNVISSNATDQEAVAAASKSAADKARELAGKYDGEIAAALTDLADGFASFESGNVTSASGFMTKLNGFQSKITSACS
ncbi:hypothetical protein WBK31_02185 [Nonomuraea sp. N2-4H]|jgi:hypothetical protein|uniref:hypothetical protein n=2 Tax=unclassified Nonomuraea TaxID=2593643 RepID=UPI0032541E05